MIECISTTDEPNTDNIQVVEVNTNEEGTEAVESAVTNILAVFCTTILCRNSKQV